MNGSRMKVIFFNHQHDYLWETQDREYLILFILTLKNSKLQCLVGTTTRDILDTEQTKSPAEGECNMLKIDEADSTLTIIVVGATGNLAKEKIFPALFALFYEDFLPQVAFLGCDLLN